MRIWEHLEDVPVLDYYDPEYRKDPHAMLERARGRGPVALDCLGVPVLLRYRDVSSALRDHRFGAPETPAGRLGITEGPFFEWNSRNLLGMDPPMHTRVRAAVMPAFTFPRVNELIPRVQEITDVLLDSLLEANQIDAVADLAYPVPVRIICDLMGVPQDRQASIGLWSRNLLPYTTDQAILADRAVVSLRHLLEELVEDRRRRPTDDLISGLAAAAQRGELAESELWNILVLLVMAGHETTKNLIGNAVYHLARRPGDFEGLRNRPDLAARALEEVLRFESPVTGVTRRVLGDVDVEDLRFERGDHVFLQIQSANRDPEAFPDPGRFDVRRPNNRHLTFGGGIHFCVGASLARLEVRIVLASLARRVRKMDLLEEPDRMDWISSLPFRGLSSLRISLTPA